MALCDLLPWPSSLIELNSTAPETTTAMIGDCFASLPNQSQRRQAAF